MVAARRKPQGVTCFCNVITLRGCYVTVTCFTMKKRCMYTFCYFFGWKRFAYKKSLEDRQAGLFLTVRMYEVLPRFSISAWEMLHKLVPRVAQNCIFDLFPAPRPPVPTLWRRNVKNCISGIRFSAIICV